MTARPRSIAELRTIAQPPAVMGRRNSEHWAGALYLRRLSIYVTRVLLPTGVSANGVTWLMIAAGWAAAASLLWPSWWGVLIAMLLLQLQILLDCSDGEVARVRGTSSPVGVYLDRIGHYTTEGLLPVAVGLHIDGGLGSIGGWTTVGALTAVVVLLNKSFGDLIHVARGYGRLPLLSEDAAVARVRVGALAKLRGALKAFPFFRSFVALEYSLITLAFATWDLVAGGHHAMHVWGVVMLPLAVFTAAGHLVAILLSDRLTSSPPAPSGLPQPEQFPEVVDGAGQAFAERDAR